MWKMYEANVSLGNKIFRLLGALSLFLVLAGMAQPMEMQNKQGPLPDFSLPKLDGEMVSLSDFKGKNAVLLVFFATWCLPCNVEVPELNRIHQEYGPKGLTLLGVDVQESKNQVERWIKSRGAQYPIVLDQKGSVVMEYGIYSVPTNILINFDGEVTFWHNVLPDAHVLDSVLQKK